MTRRAATAAPRPSGPFLRMRSRLWMDRDFKALSHAAAGLYLRLHSYLDDQENDAPTEWAFTAGDVAMFDIFARPSGSPSQDALAELLKAKLVAPLGDGAYRLCDVQGAPFEVREERKERWRQEKKGQRDTQVSGAESDELSGPDSSRAEAEATPLPRQRKRGPTAPTPPV